MTTKTETGLLVESVAFSQGGEIPRKYSCEGENVSPPIEVKGLPEETKTIAIIVEDPDAPNGIFDHWLVWNIKTHQQPIAENSIMGINGRNSFGRNGYDGPCPPSGTHRYFFKVYALDIQLDLKEGADKATLVEALQNHILEEGELMAYYRRAGD